MRSIGLSQLTDVRIVDVALQCFTQKGFHGTSTRELAALAECSVSTIYDHFQSKEDILVRIIDDVVVELNAVVTAALAVAEPNAASQLHASVDAHVTLHCERPRQTFIAATEIRSLGDSFRDSYMGQRDAYEARYTEIIQRGLQDGEFSTPYPAEATRAILAMATGVAAWFRPSGRLSVAEIARHHADMALAVAGAHPVHHVRPAAGNAATVGADGVEP